MSGNGGDLSDFSMLDLFRMELDSQTNILNQGLLALENQNASAKELERLMRAAHSIKGAARMVNVNSVVRISHVLEECFVQTQQRNLRLSHDDIDALLGSIDVLCEIAKLPDSDMTSWDAKYEIQIGTIESNLLAIANKNKRDSVVVTSNDIDARLLRDEANKQYAKETLLNEERNTLRVDVNRINRILSLAGESLVESHRLNDMMETFTQFKQQQNRLMDELNRLRVTMRDAPISGLVKSQFQKCYTSAMHMRHTLNERIVELDSFDRRNALLIERLHEEVRSTRMRPVSALVHAFPRIVRDLGRTLSKKVKLHMSGLATLVDREVLERIDTSLKHLILNAVDHGIEDESTRLNMGKTAEGHITLEVSQSAGMLFIVVEDDGKGVDLSALKRKVVKKGISKMDVLDDMDSSSLLSFLFMAGFSTRSRTDTLSGRGVGLDLVRETIEGLGGSIFVSSRPGEGTRFQLLLPQTVSIMRILLVEAAGELYGFPLSRVHRVTRIQRQDIAKNLHGYCCYFDDGTFQLISIDQLLGESVPELAPELDVVLIDQADQKIAIIVDNILGQREVSVQRLDPDLGDIPGVDSAAILDDGELTLIFSSHALAGLYSDLNAERKINLAMPRRRGERYLLLICDSPTTRETARRFLVRHDYQVITMRYSDSVVDRIRGQTPDGVIVGTDIGEDSLRKLFFVLNKDESLRHTRTMMLVDDMDKSWLNEDQWAMPQLNTRDTVRQAFLHTVNAMLAGKH
ncbi:MAG: ATP-binding protein [Gammaproteobacteria bacterium]|nr:ATP-binding protein [Gammaproteobacteria bacterium]